MTAIYKREIKSFITSPLGYVYACAYLFLSGMFFSMYILDTGYTNVVYYFGGSLIMYMFLVPILTMRLFSEERRQKTDQILLTSPVSVTSIVFGKFLAALTVFVVSMIPTVFYMMIIGAHGYLQMGMLIGNYIGIIFLGMAFIALGSFLSAITESQVIAAVSSMTVMMSLYFLDTVASSVNQTWLSNVINFISVFERYTDFTAGLFSLSSVVYYLSLCGLFLFLTVRVIEKRRWS